ncbi:SGNH/GDSL hydrolase family protein [Gottschalkiaceae bacterium SANA]|nr:SGNH/GDSL hydrolase family protein [Gottschalkiaceae bacterium SANA]
MFKRVIWPVIFIGSLLLIVIFISGLLASLVITSTQERNDEMSGGKNQQEQKAVVIQEDEYKQVLLLGDSLAMGIGDELGKNLGERYVELSENESDESKWKVVNLSVPGSQSNEWVRLLEDNFTIDFLRTADLIFLSIGGNNIKEIYEGESIAGLIEYEEKLNDYLSDIQLILDSIDKLNPSAQVVFIGLYNPYGASIGDQKIQLLLEWNHETQLRVDEKANRVYVPTYDLFKYHQDRYLSLDDFHPNEEGYAAIASRIYEVLGKKK